MRNTNFHIKNEHDKVFGENNDTIEIPYSREDDEKITSHNYANVVKTGGFNSHMTHHFQVLSHLHRNDYLITDYVGGYAHKTPTTEEPNPRVEKIGKILQKNGGDTVTSIKSNPTYKRIEKEDGTIDWARDSRGNKIVDKAPTNLTVSQAFANDPIRAANKDVKLVVTRSKEGVGGMSTGKGWTSCMNLDTGCNRHYVPKDIEHGTLTAYLVRKGDEKSIDNPVGRVNLKQFIDSDTHHKIFRPESNVYGAMPASAHKAIQHWAESVYPHKEDSIYAKHSELYNDDGNSVHITGNPSTEKISKNVEHHVRNIVDAYVEKEYEHKQKHGWGLDYNVHDDVDSYMNNLPRHHQTNLAIHHLLNAQEDPNDMYDSDMSASDHIARWTHNHTKTNYSTLHDTDLMHHLNTAEENSKFGSNYDSDMLDTATHTHHKLLKEAFLRGSQEVKDKAISHMLNNAHNYWYQQMDSDHGNEIPHLHNHTSSPALIKRMYEVGRDGTIPNILPHHADMDTGSAANFLYKVGKYGDDDILHEHVNSEHYAEVGHGLQKSFHEGLNDRPDSEERQHELISELNLGSGYAARGAVKQIKDKYDLMQAHHPHGREEGHSSEGNNEIYADIANHTKHKSVIDALKSRNDTQTPEIQSAIKNNKNFK
jgi:hypothetical protein